MCVWKYSEKGAFFSMMLRSEQIDEKGIFFTDLGNKGTFQVTHFRAKGMFLTKWCSRDSYSMMETGNTNFFKNFGAMRHTFLYFHSEIRV